MRIALERIRRGRSERSLIMVGLRGVGKTVLLNRMMRDAEVAGFSVTSFEVPENKSFLSLLAPKLRAVLTRLSRVEAAKELALRALGGLESLSRRLRIKYSEFEFGLDIEPESHLADSGDLDTDLPELFVAVGEAARAAKTAVVIAVDEMQHISTAELGALIMALHRCSQQSLPITLVGAGLPQLRGQLGDAKSYAERLFRFPMIGPLDASQARRAIVAPIQSEGAKIAPDAMDEIFRQTHGYPYFLQEWGKQSWETAPDSPIALSDVQVATGEAIAVLDESFFRVRYDRCTPQQREYMRAMAALGSGPYRSGDVAKQLGRRTEQFSQVRSDLIKKGMIWSPGHGDLEFTVPLFDEFMRRMMP